MTMVMPLFGVFAAGGLLAVLGGTMDSLLITAVGLLSVLVLAVPVVAATVADIARLGTIAPE